jgi:hypothetical protein
VSLFYRISLEYFRVSLRYEIEQGNFTYQLGATSLSEYL